MANLSYIESCNRDKELIKHALNGELMKAETESGIEYEPASKEKCNAFIIEMYDKRVRHDILAVAVARATEKLAALNGVAVRSRQFSAQYTELKEEEFKALDGYNFENSEEE